MQVSGEWARMSVKTKVRNGGWPDLRLAEVELAADLWILAGNSIPYASTNNHSPSPHGGFYH